MEIVRTLDVAARAEEIFPLVDDLGEYTRWMPLVHAVQELATDPDEDRAWDVELRATVGPLARSKRLRMVRREHDPPNAVTFERAEVDGRAHAAWVLRATIVRHGDDPTRVTLTMMLHYGGSLWTGAALQRVLDDDVERGSRNLVALLASRPS